MNHLDPMLQPRSVAIVGASERPGSVGDVTLRQLISGGFAGQVHPVNPRYQQVHGLPSQPSLDLVDGPVDLAVLAVANEHLEAEMEKVVASGAKSVVIFASCVGVAGTGQSLRDRIRDLADEAGVPVCGGNGMGFLNLEDRVRVCGFYQPAGLRPGGACFLSHSGSLFSAMLHNRRGIPFNLVVSTGLEINTSMDQYMRWALARESTTVLALFLETIRDPSGFRQALAEAEDRDVPVIALKVGASTSGKAAVATHSEGLAGDDAVYEALFDAHGVHRVETMDEMADTVELFAAGRRATAAGLGAVHDSGGERALLIDTAERVGVTLPTGSPGTRARIAAVLDPGLEPANPVDAWGTGKGAESVFVECLSALADDDQIGAVAFCVDLTTEEKPDDAYSHAALTAAASTPKPIVVLSNLSSTVDPVQATLLREGGVPVLEGTETGLRALGHLFAHHLRSARPPLADRLTAPAATGEPPSDEAGALRLLESYGIPIPAFVPVADETALDAAAQAIGFPLVLKTAESIDHKTEVGGVITGIDRPGRLREAYLELRSRLGPKVLLAEHVPGRIEIGLGMVRDPQFGPVGLISAGGTMIELLADRVAFFPRLDTTGARRALDRLRIRPLMDGARGASPVDVDALCEVIARFSELITDLPDQVRAVDVNPVICGPDRVVAVDALVEIR